MTKTFARKRTFSCIAGNVSLLAVELRGGAIGVSNPK